MKGRDLEKTEDHGLEGRCGSGWHFMVLAAVLSLVISCGYTFSTGGEQINPHIRKVYIAPFKNLTSEPYVENYFRDAFIGEFVSNRRFEIVGRPDEADATFNCTIKSLITSPLAYNANGIAIQANLNATLSFDFVENSTGNKIWQMANYSIAQNYFVSSAETLFSQDVTKQSGLIKLSYDTAERVYRLLTTGF
jgi:hypothetical protein